LKKKCKKIGQRIVVIGSVGKKYLLIQQATLKIGGIINYGYEFK